MFTTMKTLPQAIGTLLLLGVFALTTNANPPQYGNSDHWSFQPLANPAVPKARDTEWTRTDLDQFIRSAQEAKGLNPNQEASRRELIRRAYFDLIGLPPTPEEVQAFVADPDPKAYEKLVTRLLANPHYGERWGRHWLDLVRYADSNGYRYDDDQPAAYHYRDFVIRAFNDGMPYDQFVRWQIAGNELAPGNIDAMTASGFASLGPVERDEGPPLVRKTIRSDELDDIVGTTGSAMLALTMSCARCHDHKFDPISIKEFYEMVSAFNGGKREVLPVSRPVGPDEVAAKAEFDRLKEALERDLQAWDAANRPAIEPTFQELKAELDVYHAQVTKEFLKNNPDAPPAFLDKEFESLIYNGIRRTYFGNEGSRDYIRVRREYSRLVDPFNAYNLIPYNPLLVPAVEKQLTPEAKAEFKELARRLDDLKASPYFHHDSVLVYAESQPDPRPTFILERGSDAMPTEQVGLGFLGVLTAPDYRPPARPADAGSTSYQRAALADWMTNVDKGAGRLLARVMVNRLWHFHFGEGLVRTPNDFGTQGDRPENPALLDWLARRFIESGWNIKDMHSLIMTSSVYRQDTAYDEKRVAIDPDNRLLWRRTPQRLTSEVLRDTLLATSGQLNTKAHGPGVLMPIPKEAIITRSGRPYPTDLKDTLETRRRSVYAFIKRTIPIPLIQVFDGADTSISCGQRIPTTVPTQALTLMNNETIRVRSEDFAARVMSIEPESASDQARIAFELAIARTPDAEELASLEKFLSDQAALRGGDQKAALSDLCHALFNLNEFIYIN